jgi:hypothetical protein
LVRLKHVAGGVEQTRADGCDNSRTIRTGEGQNDIAGHRERFRSKQRVLKNVDI